MVHLVASSSTTLGPPYPWAIRSSPADQTEETLEMEIFKPVGPGGNWRQNAIVARHSDHEIAIGFAEVADLIIEQWKARGAFDLLFEPLVFNHRHALELVLKAAIRTSATCLRADGDSDEKVDRNEVEVWLTTKASHNLHKLAVRLGELLQRLELEALPEETESVLLSIHQLDPGGDAFRYAKIKGPNGSLVDAPRPLLSQPKDLQAHVDVVAMHEHFRSAFNLLSGGVMSELDVYADYQRDMAEDVGR
jgi:hypothetical protein